MNSELINDAHLAFEAADYKRASALYAEILSTDPDNVSALLGLGYTMHCVAQNNQAFQILQKALDIEPNNAEAHFLIGGVYYWQKKYREAEKYQRKAVALAPTVARYHLGLAADLNMLKEPELALSHLEKAYQLDPTILGSQGKWKLWRARITAGLGPLAWLGSWGFLGLLLTIGGQYSLNRLLDWIGLYLPLVSTQSGQILFRAILMSVPFVVVAVCQLRKRRYRRVVWALILWILWGSLVWYIPHRVGIW